MSSEAKEERPSARAGFPKGPIGTFLMYLAFVWLVISICLSFLFTLLSQVLLWILLFPVLIPCRRFRFQLMGFMIRFWSTAVVFFLNPFWYIKVVRPPPKGYKPKKTLIMCNHVTAADPWILARATFPWELKYVFKASMYKVPIAGYAIWLGYDIPIYFTKDKGGWGTEKGSVSNMMDYVKDLQDMNISEVIFPEGTRSRTGRLQLFKDGFFRYAVEKGCEILPCVHHNSSALWPRGSTFFGSGTVYFAFGDPIDVKVGEYTVEQLKTKVRNEMTELFKFCPLYDPDTEGPIDELPPSRGMGLIGGATTGD